jgi:hypothetical protein
MSDHRLALILAFVFGIVFLTALLALAVVIPNPTGPQFEMFRIIIALAAGGVAAVIPGMLNLRLGLGSQLALRAGGALAVFIIVYFYSPARWVAEATPAGGAIHTEGDCSPAIIGARDVNTNCTSTGKVP